MKNIIVIGNNSYKISNYDYNILTHEPDEEEIKKILLKIKLKEIIKSKKLLRSKK